MLSKEFLKEAPARYDDMGQPIGAPAAPAQTPDWLKSAGNWLGKKIGMNDPAALPDYTASNQQDAAAKSGYTGIDPVQRQRAGMAPATQQEINRYMKANPAVVGGLTDRNGNPIVSGGAQEVEKAARAAAPRRGADFDADAEVGAVDPAVIGNQFKTPNELGFQPGGSTAPTPATAPAPAAPSSVNTGGAGGVGGGGQAPGGEVKPVPSSTITATELPKSFVEPAATGTAPTPMKGGYGSGMNNPSVAPKAAAAPATDAAAAAAADNASRSTVTAKDSGDKGTTPLSSEAERMQQLAGIAPQPRERADRTADIEAASKPAFAGQTDEFGGMESPPADDLAKIKANAGLATAPEHNPEAELDSTILKTRQDQDAAARKAAEAPAQAAEPAPAQAAEPAPAPVKAFVEPEAPAAPAAPVDADTRRPGQLNPADAAKYQPAGSPAAKPAAKSDPAVLKQQQELIAKGAKIKADGIMGPATQAAIKQFAAAPAASRSTAPAAPSAGGGRGFVNPTAPAPAAAKPAAPAAPAKPAAPATAAAKPAAALPAPQTGAAGQAARAASGKAPTQVAARQSQSAVMESQEINRMRFLAGLTKD